MGLTWKEDTAELSIGEIFYGEQKAVCAPYRQQAV
jgi:hypothetical protein